MRILLSAVGITEYGYSESHILDYKEFKFFFLTSPTDLIMYPLKLTPSLILPR